MFLKNLHCQYFFFLISETFFVRCVEYLLRKNADPGVRDKQGYSAVHYASAYGRTLCLELVCTTAALGEIIYPNKGSENQKTTWKSRCLLCAEML